MNEKEKLLKSIAEIQNQIINYNRKDAINLIIKVRKEHLGKEQIAYVTNNIPLERYYKYVKSRRNKTNIKTARLERT